MKSTTRILNFNGIELTLILADGTWWIAIKPVCAALKVNYDRQYKNIKQDDFLSELYAEQHTVAADNKLRKMICLPEKYIYGWLFSLRSDSKELKQYKKECYDILWNHFHGRFSALVEKIQIDEQISEMEALLAGNKVFQGIRALEERKRKIPNRLRKMDLELLRGQTRMDL
ncbi:MAG: phage antirepressor N-terminal domain-containing protein [Cyanobacteria bacterium J06638_20]